MGGQIDWNALPLVAEMIGADDVEQLVRDLVVIRDGLRDGNG